MATDAAVSFSAFFMFSICIDVLAAVVVVVVALVLVAEVSI